MLYVYGCFGEINYDDDKRLDTVNTDIDAPPRSPPRSTPTMVKF